jgi:hypothetical protein
MDSDPDTSNLVVYYNGREIGLNDKLTAAGITKGLLIVFF